MNIFITGATGLVGTELVKRLAQHHQVTLLTRSYHKAKQSFSHQVEICTDLGDYSHFDMFDAVINLAGEPIFNKYWSNKQKQILTDSRVKLTHQLSERINQGNNPPHCFISGSAMGYYGDCGDHIIDENTPAGTAFPALLCQQWEKAALQAHTRVCLLRTGIVLAPQGGALKAMLPLYGLGLGGRLGNGEQYWAWIALEDMVRGILFLLENKDCEGSFNFVAPCPIKNTDFNRTLAQQLNRPALIPVPRWLLKLTLGERSQLLLDSQKAIPNKLLQSGFKFSYVTLKEALAKL